MALKKVDIRTILENEDLSTSEKVSGILDMLHNETDAIKDERDDIKSQLDEALKNQNDKSGEDKWRKKYEDEKKAFSDYKDSQAKKETRATKESLYKEALISAGVSEKRINAIMKVTDIEAIELDDNGKLKDAKGITKTIEEEWGEFITKEETKGAPQTDPKNDSSGGTMTKEEIMAVKDSGKRQKLIAENHELFGF